MSVGNVGKVTYSEITRRLVAERTMLAKGVSWLQIQVELGLSDYQIRKDKERLAVALVDNSAGGDIYAAYEYYRDAMMYAVGELQSIIDSPESATNYERITAIRSKTNIIDQVFKRGLEVGVLRADEVDSTNSEKLPVETTKRISTGGGSLVSDVVERFRKAIPVDADFELE